MQRRSLRAVLGPGVVVLGLSIVAAPTAAAQPNAPAPRVVVTPADNLPSVAMVRVDMSGFDPEEAVFVQQCAEVAPGVFGCDYDSMVSLDLDEEGAGDTTFTVRRVFEAHDAEGELLAESLDCAESELGCRVSVGNLQGATDATISFRDDD